MKNHIFSILAAMLCALTFASCSDNDYTQLDKGSDTLTLSADQANSELNELNHASEAITLNWTSGNNYGTGNRIYYKLELAPSGSDFSNAYAVINNETQKYTWSFNEENMNNVVLEKLGGTAGQKMALDARVTAMVSGSDEVQMSKVSFSVTPYKPVTPTLYLLGDATPNGWSADNATEMTRADNGIFTWEGKLKVGSFKFITKQGQFIPSYNKGADGKIVLRSSDDEADDKYAITEEHYYKMTANLLTGELSLVQTSGEKPAYDALFFVGNPTGWGFVKMSSDPLDKYLFRYGSYFDTGKGGEFKFGTSPGNWANMYKATKANAPYTDTSMELVSGYDPDNKWYLQDGECGKAYKICVDIRQGKERMMMSEFSPYTMIYLVGDATPSGWDLGNATAMTPTDNPYLFTWTGSLNAGEMKLSCDKKSDWNGAWFMCAAGNDMAPSGTTEQALFINKGDATFKSQYKDVNVGDVDNKWKITSAGRYTITINQLEETISIVKQ